MLYKISQLIGKLILKFYFRARIEGRENIPKEGAYIVVANHTSFLDPFLIGTTVPRIIHYLAYAYFYYHPVCHWYCKRVHNIPLKKDGKDISALKQALRVLKDGELLGIFPEGGRSETGQLGKGEPGVALIALKAKVPILPVGIRGAYEAFPKGSKFPKPHQLTITFGKPFTIADDLSGHVQANVELQEHVTALIMSKIAEVCGSIGVSAPKAAAPGA